VLQCVAVCCSVLHAPSCNVVRTVLQCVAVCCDKLQFVEFEGMCQHVKNVCVAVCCDEVHAVRCNVACTQQCIAECCQILQIGELEGMCRHVTNVFCVLYCVACRIMCDHVLQCVAVCVAARCSVCRHCVLSHAGSCAFIHVVQISSPPCM